jgi:hypothetical protein
MTKGNIIAKAGAEGRSFKISTNIASAYESPLEEENGLRRGTFLHSLFYLAFLGIGI